MLARINEMYHDDYAGAVSCYVAGVGLPRLVQSTNINIST